MGMSDWIALISAVLAVISLALNWWVVERQNKLQFESLKAQVDSEIMAWGWECMDGLSRASWLASNVGVSIDQAQFLDERGLTASTLSNLIDKGRLFFPNKPPSADQTDTSRAFRGGRPFVLNPLVFACHELSMLQLTAPDQGAAKFFTDCRKEFLSELQHLLDPRRREEEFSRLGRASPAEFQESYRDSLKLAQALEARYPGILVQKADKGWANNVERAAKGDFTPQH